MIAETAAQAADGAERVVVEYEELPFVVGSENAAAPGAPAIWDEVPDNVFVDTRFGDWEATDAAFAKADHVVGAEFHIGRVTAVTIEPRAALADYDPATGRSTLYAGSGGAVRQKRELSTAFGIDPDKLRVLSFDVGGNFGARNRVYPEFGLVLWASRKLGRPVKFTATRSETFLSDYQGRDLVSKVELALDRNGKFLAMRADNLSDVGAHCVSLSPLSKGSGLITGSYDIPVATLRARAVFTNTMCTQAYRSSGRPEVTYAIERLVDKAARELGMDPLELRRKNLVPSSAMPYRNAVGQIYDSGEYEKNMDRVLELADWAGFPARKREAAKRGKLLGFGLANYVESSIGTPKERAEIEVKPEGAIEVVIGTQPSGQGHETSFAQVVADLIEVPVDKVTIVLGDTDIVSVGGGTHSGRSMRHAATVMAKASADLIAEGRRRFAAKLNAAPERVDFDGGRFILRGTNHAMDLFELARETIAERRQAAGRRRQRDAHAGVPERRRGLRGRDRSGNRAGHHHALFHRRRRRPLHQSADRARPDPWRRGAGRRPGDVGAMRRRSATGQPLTGSLMDYGMPRSNTVPSITAEIAEVLSPTNPLGIKAGGEGGTTPALATVVNAVLDALKDVGVTDITMPATPYTVWRAIQDAKART